MRWWYRLWQLLSQVVFSVFLGLRVFGREHVPRRGAVLLLSNHQSFLDPVLCGVGLPREMDYIARDSLFRNRLFAWYIRSLNAFPIQRGQADLTAIRTILRRLQLDRGIVLFPEATRTDDGRIRPVKGGFELLIRKAKVPTLPVVIDGAYEAWPRDQLLPGMGRVTIRFGKPILPAEVRALGRDGLVDLVNRRLRQMQYEVRRSVGRTPFTYPDAD
ncbi:MAG: 1-acyl-sn-glycerol-3-phosphate acyltransferase [Sedimentisphaerales bacterium]|nr:1-acyl-sn-glycerol-3-phosphate acyltransferase [Sedimentisphaerales bacterium]